MSDVIIYTLAHCPYCKKAKGLFDELQIPFEEKPVDEDPLWRDRLEKLTGRRTVPQIFIHGNPIGGCDDLFALHEANKLLPLIDL